MAKAGKSQSSTKPKPIKLKINGQKRTFDIDDPKLPNWIDDSDLSAGGYPYDKRMKRSSACRSNW